MKLDVLCCFFATTDSPDGKIPEQLNTKKLDNNSKKIINKKHHSYPATPFVSTENLQEDLQFDLQLDNDDSKGYKK